MTKIIIYTLILIVTNILTMIVAFKNGLSTADEVEKEFYRLYRELEKENNRQAVEIKQLKNNIKNINNKIDFRNF